MEIKDSVVPKIENPLSRKNVITQYHIKQVLLSPATIQRLANSQYGKIKKQIGKNSGLRLKKAVSSSVQLKGRVHFGTHPLAFPQCNQKTYVPYRHTIFGEK